ncbi:uncharacterized protein LOC131144841 [Malania oleifera]|uniref:uncharacterized protein LOC131144841 n=1 Tax=Malania oleifera TaxID=397392 RepID=UPI0025AE9219|nr:uncharacterized protein LOC131144841 [Malania oleifera]
MEALYLLCSVISTFVTSLTLSLHLPFRWLLRRLWLRSVAPDSVSLYQGTIWHERTVPVHHSFSYPVRYALIDLDRAPRPVPNPNHLSADHARRVAQTHGPVFLLTIPPSVGYEQNPLSLYFCYDTEDSSQNLKKCIAEVTNTPWGERVSFVFNPTSDLVAKPLHVSPFMDMLGNWRFRTTAPGDNLFVVISVQHPELGDYFRSILSLKKVSSSFEADHDLFFWLMPHKVALWIYWQALKLWWKNVPLIQHPKYLNSSYREEALMRNRRLECCPAIGLNKHKYLQVEGSDSEFVVSRQSGDRWFAWRDAKWPWS